MRRSVVFFQAAGVLSFAALVWTRGSETQQPAAWQWLRQEVLDRTRGADPYKRILSTQSCDQKQAGLINTVGGVPGVTGPVTGVCSDGNGGKCVMCELGIVGPPPPDQIVGTSTTVYTPPGLRTPTSNACGELHVGTCLNMGTAAVPVYECVDIDGSSHGTCANSIIYQLQPAGS